MTYTRKCRRDSQPSLLNVRPAFPAHRSGADMLTVPSGETEPAYNSTMKVAIAGSTVNNGTFTVAGTCSGCRQWGSDSSTQPFILAWGADADFLATDDLATRVKQHSGYGNASAAESVPRVRQIES